MPELISGVVGSVIGGFILHFLQSLRTRRKLLSESEEFPIEGEYITYFEDKVNGKSIVATSESTITQEGKRIFGVTKHSDGRSWNLDGNIIGSGHIAGAYSADAHYDEGVGSFYLKIDGDILEGMWSGYDHENKTTATGKYEFRRKATIKIRDANIEDISSILDLSSPLFGEGYVNDIREFINSKKAVAVVAIEDTSPVGFILGKHCDESEAKVLIKNTEKLPADINNSDKEGTLGVIQTLGVASSRQGRGIGEGLFVYAESYLKKLGVKTIVVPAWNNGEKINISGLLKHFSYTHFFSDPNYWKAKCENEKFHCPSKIGDECACSVEFYKKSL